MILQTCSDRCIEFRDCVQCQQYQTGPLKNPEDCASNCTTFTPHSVEEVIGKLIEIIIIYIFVKRKNLSIYLLNKCINGINHVKLAHLICV